MSLARRFFRVVVSTNVSHLEIMDVVDTYVAARDRFRKLAMISSGLSLLGAGASRLPTWEVSSPAGWLVGTVNVGFLPVFGPILILGAFCNVYLRLCELADLRAAIEHDPNYRDSSVVFPVRPSSGSRHRRDGRLAIASWGLNIWNFWIPVIAYAVLVSTYFDFVRPRSDTDVSPMYAQRSIQVADLLVGLGGWKGFRPTLPSIQANLLAREQRADKTQEAERLHQLAETLPWIYPPYQTWIYVIGLTVLVYMAWGTQRLVSSPSARYSGTV